MPLSTASPSPSSSAAPTGPAGDSFGIRPAQQPANFVNEIACNGPIGASDPVAIVRPRAAVYTGEQVLYDYADAGNPRIACTFGVARIAQLVDPRHVVIEGGSTWAVVDLPEVRYHWFEIGTVAPGLDEVVWAKGDLALGAEIHMTTSTADLIVASVPDDHGDRCGRRSNDVAYSRSGAHVFVLHQSNPPLDSLLVVAGQTPVMSLLPPSAGWAIGAEPAVAVWSPTSEALFYRQAGDAWKWTPADGPQRFLPGIAWSNASVSGDGAHLAYSIERADQSSVDDADRVHDVYLVDLHSAGSPELIGTGGRGRPAFLNATKLWYMAAGDRTCGGYFGEMRLEYDVLDGSESVSQIDDVIAAWPATSSQVP